MLKTKNPGHTAERIAIPESELAELRALIEQRSAILLDASRERFFSVRVNEHLAEKKLKSVTELLRHIRSSNLEYEALLERLLTQETSFFRYPAVFDALTKEILPSVQDRKMWRNPRGVRVWSAGCSTGEEAYSIAIAICDALKFAEAWEIEILATDISRRALRHAERGLYPRRELDALSPPRVDTHFSTTKHGMHVRPRLRRMISFAQMNLADGAYTGKFDCIFCMNVLMYFSPERRRNVLQRFFDALEPGGYFLLGHAETLSDAGLPFESIVRGDCRMYRKPLAARLAVAQPAPVAAGGAR